MKKKNYFICENNPGSCDYISWNKPKPGEQYVADENLEELEKETKKKTTKKSTTKKTTTKKSTTKKVETKKVTAPKQTKIVQEENNYKNITIASVRTIWSWS